MKNELEHFNKEILDYQIRLAKQDGDEINEQDYLWFDRLTYTECNGIYDINYYAAEYGFQSTSKEDLEHSEPSSFIDEDGYLDCYEHSLDWLIDILIKNAEKIGSLTFLNPRNCGYNGSANWDFVRLAEADVVFTNLEKLKVQLYEIGDHNISYIGEVDGDGNEQVTQLLAKCPNIASIELPTTPDQDFFKMKFPKLSYMKVQGTIDSKHFIKNLSNSPLLSQMSVDFMDCLLDNDLLTMSEEERVHIEKIKQQEAEIANSDTPRETRKKIERQRLKECGLDDVDIALAIDRPNREETLRLLRIKEDSEKEVKELMDYYDETDRWLENGEYDWDNDIDNFDDDDDDDDESETLNKKTEFEDYKALMQSKYITESWHFTLRECYLSQDQLKALNQLNSNIQFLYVPTQECYYLRNKF